MWERVEKGRVGRTWVYDSNSGELGLKASRRRRSRRSWSASTEEGGLGWGWVMIVEG